MLQAAAYYLLLCIIFVCISCNAQMLLLKAIISSIVPHCYVLYLPYKYDHNSEKFNTRTFFVHEKLQSA